MSSEPPACELCVALARDLDASFERLVRLYQDRLYRFALRLTGSPRDAEEAAQDAFVRSYAALREYPPDRIAAISLRPWLYQVTLNVVRNRSRGKHLRLVPLDGEKPEHDAPDSEALRPDALAERAEAREELATLLTALPEPYRAAVVLRHVEGLAYAEAAEILGQPVGTVKSNVHRGVEQLRDALQAQRSEERYGL